MITNFLLPGVILGLTAGLSPGPLLTLVISETLMHGKKNGIKVALAPLFTDIPIILTTILIFSQLKGLKTILGVISIFGGIFLIYLGYKNLRVNKNNFEIKKTKTKSLHKGIFVNALNPHPYVFWFSVGGSFLVKSNFWAGGLFLLSFYLLLIGSKVGIAVITDKSKTMLKSQYFIWLVRILGTLLFLYAIILIKDGITYFQTSFLVSYM